MGDLTVLYCDVDDFWKQFKLEWEAHLIDSGKIKRGPEPELSISEMMTIVILFHQSNYRTFRGCLQSLFIEQISVATSA